MMIISYFKLVNKASTSNLQIFWFTKKKILLVKFVSSKECSVNLFTGISQFSAWAAMPRELLNIVRFFYLLFPGSVMRWNRQSTVYLSPAGWGYGIHRLHLCSGVRPPPQRVLDMTSNHLMARLQPWRFEECEVPPHCHCSQVHSDPEW